MRPKAWRHAAASVQGTSHAKLGSPCQDAHACEVFAAAEGETILVAVVSDGAGSASRSQDGACLACNLVVDEVRTLCELGLGVAEISRETICDWLVSFQSEVAVRAEADGLTPRDFACTLVAAVVGPEHAAFFQVGDGAMVVADGEDYSWVFWPDQGEYENLTFFATDPTAADHLQFDLCCGSRKQGPQGLD